MFTIYEGELEVPQSSVDQKCLSAGYEGVGVSLGCTGSRSIV